ncbi:MAG: regulatory protein RecX [Actinomycetota bacterium]
MNTRVKGDAERGPKGGRKLGLHDRALGLLAVRMRSRRELEQRLLRAGFEAGEVAEELQRLEAVNLIDDDAFAEAFAEQAVNGRKGGRAIASGLYAKGVDRATIDRVVAGSTDGEFERALEFAEGRVRRMSGVAPPKAHKRIVDALMRRGYTPDTAREAARRALSVPDDED